MPAGAAHVLSGAAEACGAEERRERDPHIRTRILYILLSIVQYSESDNARSFRNSSIMQLSCESSDASVLPTLSLGATQNCVAIQRPLVLEKDAIGLADDLLDVDGVAAKVLHCPVLDQVVEDEERLDHELAQLGYRHSVESHFHAQGEL